MLTVPVGKFKSVGGHASKADAESLAASLLSLESEKMDVVASSNDQIISDSDLDLLLDRSPEVFTGRGIGWEKARNSDQMAVPEAGQASVAFKVFDRAADELNDGLAKAMEED